MILHQILREMESTQEPTTLAELSRKLNVEPNSLRGMIQFLAKKGRLDNDRIALCIAHATASPDVEQAPSCFSPSCAAGCWQVTTCSEQE